MIVRKCEENEKKFFEELKKIFALESVKEVYETLPNYANYKSIEEARDKFKIVSNSESYGMGSGRLRQFGHCNGEDYYFGQPEEIREGEEHREILKMILQEINKELGHNYDYLWLSDLESISKIIEKESKKNRDDKKVTLGIALLKSLLDDNL